MNICEEEFQLTEKKVKDYFLRLKKIEFYQSCILNTQERLKRVQQNIEKSNIILCSTYSSIDYSADKIEGSPTIYNGIEKKIDSAFNMLEEQEKKLNQTLIELQVNIDNLQMKNEEIGFILNLLNDESKKIIDLVYKKEKNLYNIADNLHMSKSNVARKKEQILEDIARWIYTVC